MVVSFKLCASVTSSQLASSTVRKTYPSISPFPPLTTELSGWALFDEAREGGSLVAKLCALPFFCFLLSFLLLLQLNANGINTVLVLQSIYHLIAIRIFHLLGIDQQYEARAYAHTYKRTYSTAYRVLCSVPSLLGIGFCPSIYGRGMPRTGCSRIDWWFIVRSFLQSFRKKSVLDVYTSEWLLARIQG